MSIAIKAENISKAYQLGEIGTGTLSRDLERWISRVRGKEDPFLQIGETNDRTTKGNSNMVWSLKDINFDIEQGDAVGIIGRNGAGKSTLLKVLSRVTSPTTGRIKGKGRIASLLEVGTGFHPELTGRENTYLNGAILGMRKREIGRKFDEIVEFAGVERYIDTPVKRYSSGMYVRLAFAVAAHLDSEILIVDEVLAVGDAEFQKKCLGKMGDISKGEGRTILFVSHNMASIQNLCSKGILLKHGELAESGDMEKVISKYISTGKLNNQFNAKKITNRQGNGKAKIVDIKLYNQYDRDQTVFNVGEPLSIKIFFEEKAHENYAKTLKLDIGINDNYSNRIAWMSTKMNNNEIKGNRKSLEFRINALPIREGTYSLTVFCETEHGISDWMNECLSFEIVFNDYYKVGKLIPQGQGQIVLDYIIN